MKLLAMDYDTLVVSCMMKKYSNGETYHEAKTVHLYRNRFTATLLKKELTIRDTDTRDTARAVVYNSGEEAKSEYEALENYIIEWLKVKPETIETRIVE